MLQEEHASDLDSPPPTTTTRVPVDGLACANAACASPSGIDGWTWGLNEVRKDGSPGIRSHLAERDSL
jgi:hypothetical protein